MFKNLVVFAFVLCLAASHAAAYEFSADTVMTSREGSIKGTLAYKKDKFRMDMLYPDRVITITRVDKGIAWTIMDAEKMYIEFPLTDRKNLMVQEKVDGEIERKLVGTEVFDGRPAKKYLVTYRSGTATQQLYQWWATDINFPVKTAAVDGSWTQEYRNVRIKAQPDWLFEVPPGYQRLQMPSGMPVR